MNTIYATLERAMARANEINADGEAVAVMRLLKEKGYVLTDIPREVTIN